MTTQKVSKGLNITLWIAQGILTVMFLMAGSMKATQPIEELVASGMNWAGDLPSLTRFIGVCQVLGAIGLILPAALRIKPSLTAWAATGLATCMLFAVIFHIARDEAALVGAPLFLGIVATFVAWGRFKKVVIQPK